MRDITVGTAGHIDHGKTSLIKALTGVDADRLPEEKQRGITIDIGFAELDLGEVRIGFVDVPGHERFVKNMLAGVSGIDLVMLVVAADEGVMPQTREHFDICRLLGLEAGFVVLTKIDLADAETIELARLDVAELVAGSFLEDAPVIEVSSRSLAGIDALREHLRQSSQSVSSRSDRLSTRLPIDRSFTVKGFGAVVTGTLAAGEIRDGDELQLMPDGRGVRVRGLQTHGRKAGSVHAGQRVAVNIAGVDHDSVNRGMQLCEAGVFRPSQVIDTSVRVLKTAARPLRSRQRVRLHVGTAEVLARISVLNDANEIVPGEAGIVQLRLEHPIVCVPDERFIIRQYSPQQTIAGGRVLDPLAEKHRRKDRDTTLAFLTVLAESSNGTVEHIAAFVDRSGRTGTDSGELQARTGLRPRVLAELLDELSAAGRVVNADEQYVSAAAFDRLCGGVIDELGRFHKSDPLARGMPLDVLRDLAFKGVSPAVSRTVLAKLELDGMISAPADVVRLAGHSSDLSPAEKAASETISAAYRNAGLDVPRLEEVLNEAVAHGCSPEAARKLLRLKLDSGEIVKVTDEFYFASAIVDGLAAKLRRHAAETGNSLLDVAQFKEIAGISRKYAIPLLEYFDRTRVTRRAADKRIILG
ncbi:MAG: selenocysteine-specific translation elongation factor [Pyrinomonadaceae bacterium]|nr:selenocysteine-specific translation elongation factor [Pyrinomonadaceae bacterium]